MGGGLENLAEERHATVGGGWRNLATNVNCTIAGGRRNMASGWSATVGGGDGNTASAGVATVGGGAGNIASGPRSFIGGGRFNQATTNGAAVVGGYGNCATNEYAFIGGGSNNVASGWAATVPGGYSNSAAGDYSFAAGRAAVAEHAGSFVWADTSLEAPFASTTTNEVSFRCQGGVRFTSGDATNTNQTVAWTPGAGSWSFSSDRNLKAGFTPVDGRSVLDKVSRLSITEWNFTGYPQRHIGPMAQDFHAAFGLGTDDKHIATVDADGVALAAIQGLNQKLECGQQKAEDRVERLEAENAELKEAVNELRKLVQSLMQESKGGAR